MLDGRFSTIPIFLVLYSLICCSCIDAANDNKNNDTTSVVFIEEHKYTSNGCECKDYSCGCCAHLEEHSIHLNTSVCINSTYLREDYGISITITWNDVTIYNETVSARNPPPYCVGAPFVKELAEVCLRLHDISATRHKFHACAEAEARFHKVLIANYELGCFTIGHDNSTFTQEPDISVVLI